MKKLPWIMGFLFLLAACDKKEEAGSAEMMSDAEYQFNAKSDQGRLNIPSDNKKEMPAPEMKNANFIPPPAETSQVAQTEKKIIRNAHIRYQVQDHKVSALNIEKTVKNHGGYISGSNEQNTNYSRKLQTTMSIRVLNTRFDELVGNLLKEAIYVEQKNITSEDVTTQFIDTEARLKAKKEVENRYVELLKKAKTVEEILQIENQLAAIREEIEAKEGVLNYLSDQVAYSTINLEFYERIEGQVQPEDGFFTKVFRGIEQGWDLLLNFIIGLFYVWPFVLIVTLIIYLIIRRRRKKREKAS